jgi:hypothetical protein
LSKRQVCKKGFKSRKGKTPFGFGAETVFILFLKNYFRVKTIRILPDGGIGNIDNDLPLEAGELNE